MSRKPTNPGRMDAVTCLPSLSSPSLRSCQYWSRETLRDWPGTRQRIRERRAGTAGWEGKRHHRLRGRTSRGEVSAERKEDGWQVGKDARAARKQAPEVTRRSTNTHVSVRLPLVPLWRQAEWGPRKVLVFLARTERRCSCSCSGCGRLRVCTLPWFPKTAAEGAAGGSVRKASTSTPASWAPSPQLAGHRSGSRTHWK